MAEEENNKEIEKFKNLMTKIKGKPEININFEKKLAKFKTDQDKWVKMSKDNLKVSFKNVFSDKIFKNSK